MCLDDLSEPSGCAVSDLPGTVEQAVHQRLTHPLEWPLVHLKQTHYIHNTMPHTSTGMATRPSETNTLHTQRLTHPLKWPLFYLKHT